jgi:RimJ/RimL family protein N-acetyltransferase
MGIARAYYNESSLRNREEMASPDATLPVGQPVELGASVPPSRVRVYPGKFVTLKPCDPEKDVAELYPASHGSENREQLWTYMAYGPFRNERAMLDWLQECQRSSDPLVLTVHANDLGRPVGMASFLNIVPAMRRLELGQIWYSPSVQRTKVNTETVYIMLREAFDALAYRRVEWKCDSLNSRSRVAALRLGFSFEGIFRNHMIVKDRNRDTAWYALLDTDWPAVKRNMERWLYAEGPHRSLAELNHRQESDT